jgi:NAD+ synthase
MAPLLSRESLKIDCAQELEKITQAVREQVTQVLRRRGAVVGLSGGIDSTLVAALCVRALGPDRVFGILMPEEDSAPESTDLGKSAAASQGIPYVVENITPILRGAGCYERRDAAIRKMIPEYGGGYRSKIVLPSVIEDDRMRVFSLVVQSPQGEVRKLRMPANVYREVIAATNFKQRSRMMIEYFHADRLNYAVAGTANRLEHELGFFVKHGDGAADFKPIAHLYKTQVYQLAEHLGVPREILSRPATTDTYSLPQSQEEFFFSLPLDRLDLCLFAHDNGFKEEDVAPGVGLTIQQVQRIYRDIEFKRRAAHFGHLAPLLVDEGVAQKAGFDPDGEKSD